ncbi:MAG: zinc-dependent alcohol dehydrogenase [Ktedonobacteraceae bacterium]
MWTSTLEISMQRVIPTQLLGRFWRGAYFSAFAPLQVKNLPRPQLTSAYRSWVRVSNRLAGICGSDLHLVFVDGDLRIAPAALPSYAQSYPGHEVVGEVIEIGEQVQNLRVGDRVVLQSGPNCLSAGVQPLCRSCASGNYNLCEHATLTGPQQIGGGWSEEMLVHEQQVFRIPEEMEDEQAVLLEPTAVALHAVLRRPPQANEKVLIVGAGTIGLLTLQVVRALAPQAEVSMLARHNFQVEQATRLGAAHILYEHNTYEHVKVTTGAKLYQGILGNKMLLGGYDVIYDTIGTRQTVHDSLRWTRARGTVVLVGLSLHQMNLDLSPIWHQEVNLIGTTGHGMESWPAGSSQQRPTFALASDLVSNGLLHPEKLITHRFALSNFREALQTATDKKGSRAIKVVFDAALLPASSVPNMHAGSRTRLPAFIGGDVHTPLPTAPTMLDLTPASQDAPLTGPSHFTMAQSEDFSADFDNTHFMAPKPRRPPSPLQFPRTTEDIPESTLQSSPTNATNVEPPALEKAEELAENSAPQE